MDLKLSSSNARKILLGTWFAFFVVNLAVIFFLYFDKSIEEDNLRMAVQQIHSNYVTYLGVMAAFYLSQKAPAGGGGKQAGMSFAVAMFGSILWNLVICGFMLRLIVGGTIEDAVRQIGFFGPLLSWLVAPAVGFYFANPSMSANKSARRG